MILDPETGQEYVFLANRLDLTALEIAALYRRRWQIELFFKWIKQHLKIKAFYGTSKNAVLIQVWTALIAYLLLFRAKLKSTVSWGLLELTRLVQTRLMERYPLWEILCPRDKAPPPKLFFLGYPLHSSIYNILWLRYIPSKAQIAFGQRGNRDGLLN